jgi:hypothetical protein
MAAGQPLTMSGNHASAVDIMSLAWACYREPLRLKGQFQEAIRLPEGLHHLLKIAAGDDSQMAVLSAATGASPSELRVAAIFIVKQVFFSPYADHYRVLGVDPDASLDQIKEHHRLLMRLFHPDRDRQGQSWESAYASRINQSYNVLRNLASRQLYDAAHKPATPTKAQPGPVRRRHYIRHSRSEMAAGNPRLPGVVVRNLPQFVLGGLALLAVSVIYLVYAPAHTEAVATQLSDVSEKEVGLAEDDLARVDQLVSRMATHLKNAALQPPLDHVQATTAAHPENHTKKQDRVNALENTSAPARIPEVHERLPQTESQPELHNAMAESPAPSRMDRSPAPTPPVAIALSSAPPVPVLAKIEPVKLEPAKVVPAQVKPAVTAPSPDQELDVLLKRFVSSYEQGDIESYLALFDDQARTSDEIGKAAIRKSYATLFNSSQFRQLSLKEIHWLHAGDPTRAEGRFALHVLGNGDNEIKTYVGNVRFILGVQGNALLIKGLFYDQEAVR